MYVSQNWRDLILGNLSASDLPFALNWIQCQETTDKLSTSFSDLLEGILLTSWRHITEPQVTVAVCSTAISLWLKHDHILPGRSYRRNWTNNPNVLTTELILEDDSKRYAFLRYLIPIASRYERIGYYLTNDAPLLDFKDTNWLIDYFIHSNNHQEKEFVIELLHYIIRLANPEHFQFIFDAGEKHPELWQALNYTSQLCITLDSEYAKKLREEHLQRIELDRRHEEYKQEQENRPALTPSPTQMLLANLKKFDQGETKAWWQMSQWMDVKPDGQYMHEQREYEYTCQKLPVWQELNEEQKEHIISSSPIFIQRFEPDNDQWWAKTDRYFYSIIAGCRAFYL